MRCTMMGDFFGEQEEQESSNKDNIHSCVVQFFIKNIISLVILSKNEKNCELWTNFSCEKIFYCHKRVEHKNLHMKFLLSSATAWERERKTRKISIKRLKAMSVMLHLYKFSLFFNFFVCKCNKIVFFGLISLNLTLSVH